MWLTPRKIKEDNKEIKDVCLVACFKAFVLYLLWREPRISSLSPFISLLSSLYLPWREPHIFPLSPFISLLSSFISRGASHISPLYLPLSPYYLPFIFCGVSHISPLYLPLSPLLSSPFPPKKSRISVIVYNNPLITFAKQHTYHILHI